MRESRGVLVIDISVTDLHHARNDRRISVERLCQTNVSFVCALWLSSNFQIVEFLDVAQPEQKPCTTANISSSP